MSAAAVVLVAGLSGLVPGAPIQSAYPSGCNVSAMRWFSGLILWARSYFESPRETLDQFLRESDPIRYSQIRCFLESMPKGAECHRLGCRIVRAWGAERGRPFDVRRLGHDGWEAPGWLTIEQAADLIMVADPDAFDPEPPPHVNSLAAKMRAAAGIPEPAPVINPAVVLAGALFTVEPGTGKHTLLRMLTGAELSRVIGTRDPGPDAKTITITGYKIEGKIGP